MKYLKERIITAVGMILLLVMCTTSSCYAQENETVNDYLIGQELWYKYSGGMSFHVKFEPKGLSYQNLAGSKPESWWGPFPFNSILTKNDEYLISWYEEGYGDYVTLLVDLEAKTLLGSALIITKGGPKTHLQSAVIFKRKNK